MLIWLQQNAYLLCLSTMLGYISISMPSLSVIFIIFSFLMIMLTNWKARGDINKLKKKAAEVAMKETCKKFGLSQDELCDLLKGTNNGKDKKEK